MKALNEGKVYKYSTVMFSGWGPHLEDRCSTCDEHVKSLQLGGRPKSACYHTLVQIVQSLVIELSVPRYDSKQTVPDNRYNLYQICKHICITYTDQRLSSLI